MDVLHIRNLEKYNPGYKDRHLIWFKFYFSMVDSNDEFEMLDEIDKWRFAVFIVLELKNKKPVLLDKSYLARKGFNFQKKPLKETLDALSPFIEVCNMGVTKCNGSVTQNRIEYNIIDNIYSRNFQDLWDKYPLKDGKKQALRHFNASVKTQKDLSDISIALDNYLNSDRVKNGYIKNGSTWFNNWRDWLQAPEKRNLTWWEQKQEDLKHAERKGGEE